MTIEINNESAIPVDETVLLRLMEHNLAELHVSADADVAIVLVDEGAMEALHVQWMDEPGPTDVLSFPMDELRPGTEDAPTPPGLLGDIVLCPQVAETQARDAKPPHPTQDELVMLTTHGLLHLLGFDHAEPEDAAEMFGLQRDLIVAFTLAERRRARG
jgi:probable rRNA maturation factor